MYKKPKEARQRKDKKREGKIFEEAKEKEKKKKKKRKKRGGTMSITSNGSKG